jgi:hypothetical protein
MWTRVGLESCLHVAVSAPGSSFIATADLQVGIPMAAHSHVYAALGTRARPHHECSPPASPGSNSAFQSGHSLNLFRYQGSCAGVLRLRPATRFLSTSQHPVLQSGRLVANPSRETVLLATVRAGHCHFPGLHCLDLPLFRPENVPGEGPSGGIEKRAQAVAGGLWMPPGHCQ